MSSNDRGAELHFEVLRQPPEDDDDRHTYLPSLTIRKTVSEWLRQTSGDFFLNTYVELPIDDSLPHSRHIQSIRVVDYCGPGKGDVLHNLDGMSLKVHVYELHDACETTKNFTTRKAQQSERMVELPNITFAGTWDSLIFNTIDILQILRSIARIIVLMKQPGLNIHALNLNRLVLLHGPPGCGKTTLCRALAHKLSIRLSSHFPSTRLFEINTQSLLSKFYSESGRLISELFEKILSQSRNADTLICVLIDEVESIASSREKLSETGECHDSIRATNQLLTALDRVREQPNVMIFCTSNMKTAIDVAFLDRVDYAIAVPPPCQLAIYEILRSTINELIRCGLVTPSTCEVQDRLTIAEDRMFIPAGDKLVYLREYPESPARIVAALAAKCKGFSGRKMRKLPLLAITTHTWGETCPLADALEALNKAVDLDLGRCEDAIMV